MPNLEIPNYEALMTIEAVEAEIQRHERSLLGKDRTESLIKKEKREYVKALNEQLKELLEEREHEIDVISALEDRRRVLHAQLTANIYPLGVSMAANG